MSATRCVVRCPECGSTDAGADESRSAYEFTFMQCAGCGHGALQDEWQIRFDWNVDLELASDAALPAYVPLPVPPRWVVMGRDTFAREDYVVGEFASQAEARACVEEREARTASQDEALRDSFWVVPSK